ncbi:class I adenylate-forming enzyme family protein [Streptomyces galbus]|uniref:Acyl--CoA ligase n=1 Tax=Streptomyces galbus TaxID=33898 RepID=A0A4U5W7V2_STRGB|nr:class I adenylate-forming enzyme family protein [Streptomyces galbus]TKS96760.1 acyl--CoA ligase [Streptomyces galbus]GHD54292.1 long-chain-fatty-acid--CoA ligase [Streptomyces galbus]
MATTQWMSHLLDRGADDDLWAISSAPVTRGQLRGAVADFEEGFRQQGIGAGNSVLLRMTPSFTYIQVLLALWNCGAQVVLVDFRLKPAEYEPLAQLVRPQYLVAAAGAGGPVAGFRQESDFTVRRLPDGRPAVDGIQLVQFSSGSSGRPKVIGRPADSVLAEIDRHAGLPGVPGEDDRVMLLNSVMHNMGLVSGVLHALASGAGLIVPPTLRPAEVVRLMAATGATAVYGTPVHYDLLSRVADRPRLPALRLAVSGGERVPQETYENFRARFGLPVSPVYGLTETGLIAGDLSGTSVPPQLGLPVPGAEIKIVDEELYVRMDRSPYLYGEHADRYTHGWLRTYDRVRQDPVTGVLSMLGRADSLAVIGGLKVDLAEVENVLLTHTRVTEAVVTHGEVIEAFVGADPGVGADELTAWCRERLSPVKVPKRFHVSRLLPRNSMGKLVRDRALMHGRVLAESPSRAQEER